MSREQIHYFTAPTLPELEKNVNENIESFHKDDDKDFHYSADFICDVKHINGEYVQTVIFSTFKKMIRPAKPKPNPNKKTAKRI